MNRFLHYTALAAAAVGLTMTARALPTHPALQIWDGINPAITILDNNPGDGNLALGAVQWSGTIGVWTINVDTGLTKPVQGSPSSPYMDLNFVDKSIAPGTLTLKFSEDWFGPGSGTSFARIGGTTAGTVIYDTYWDPANALFALTNPLTAQGPFGPGAFSGDQIGGAVVSPLAPYSLTQVIVIAHAVPGTTSGDAELTIPDNGASIMLLGAGVTALALFGRMRKRLF